MKQVIYSKFIILKEFYEVRLDKLPALLLTESSEQYMVTMDVKVLTKLINTGSQTC